MLFTLRAGLKGFQTAMFYSIQNLWMVGLTSFLPKTKRLYLTFGNIHEKTLTLKQ